MMTDDLAMVAARFGAELRHAGVPADPGRCERFARAVTVARPATRRELYLCALATLVSGQSQIETLERVFNAMFGSPADPALPGRDQRALPLGRENPGPEPQDMLAAAARAAKAHDGQAGGAPPATTQSPLTQQRAGSLQPSEQDGAEPDTDAVAARPVLASTAERLAGKDFAELTPAELLMLAGLMSKLTLAVPRRTASAPICGPRCARRGAPGVNRCGWPGARRPGSPVGWSCCATSQDRWSRTPGLCCSCRTARRVARERRYSRSRPG